MFIDLTPKSFEPSATKAVFQFFDEKVSSTEFQPTKCPSIDDTLPHSSLDLHPPIDGKSEEHQRQERLIG